MTALHRHAFVWLDSSSAELPALLREWIGQHRPLVVRRPCLSPDGKNACLGLALPPSLGKNRVPFELPRELIRKVSGPPLWSDCATISDVAARPFHEAAAAGGAELRTFGSHAWQHLTGLQYVTEHSDIDLLIFLESQASWDAVRKKLAPFALPPGIDLEIVVANDASFSWREYSGPQPSLLFKGNSSVWSGGKDDVDSYLSYRALQTPGQTHDAIS